ncbi:MAG: TonB-dependent receptor, partial [Chromatocurvus sp.]
MSDRNSFAVLRKPLVAATLLASVGAVPAVSAQGSGVVLEEVVVTAQRREQSLQEVPMAVSAFTRQQLQDLQADNLDSIQGAVPNLNLVQGRGSNSSVNIFLRGVGQPDALQSFDPAVGVYLDDVYMSRIQGAMFKLYDIERIEVLRGPQGTLYGKNTPGGAIKLITRNPGEELEASASLTLGNYDRVQGSAYVSGPITDTLSAGISVLHDERDGFVTDPVDGREYNDDSTTVARIKSIWSPTDRLEVTFSADYTKEDVALTLGSAEAPLISVDLAGGAPVRFVPSGDNWDFDSRTSLGDADGQQTDHWGANLTLAWELSEAMTFKSITAYRELESELFIDIDATTLELGDVFVAIDQDQFSQEFQILGDNNRGLTWVAGAYY